MPGMRGRDERPGVARAGSERTAPRRREKRRAASAVPSEPETALGTIETPQKQVNDSMERRSNPVYTQEKPVQRKPATDVLPTKVG